VNGCTTTQVDLTFSWHKLRTVIVVPTHPLSVWGPFTQQRSSQIDAPIRRHCGAVSNRVTIFAPFRDLPKIDGGWRVAIARAKEAADGLVEFRFASDGSTTMSTRTSGYGRFARDVSLVQVRSLYRHQDAA